MKFGLVLTGIMSFATAGVLVCSHSAQSAVSRSADIKCLSVAQKAAWEQAKLDAGPGSDQQPILNSMTTEIRSQSVETSPVRAIRVGFALLNNGNRSYEVHSQLNENHSDCSIARVSLIK